MTLILFGLLCFLLESARSKLVISGPVANVTPGVFSESFVMPVNRELLLTSASPTTKTSVRQTALQKLKNEKKSGSTVPARKAAREVIDQYGAVQFTNEEVPLGYVEAMNDINDEVVAYNGPLPQVPPDFVPYPEPQAVKTFAPIQPANTPIANSVTFNDLAVLINIVNGLGSVFSFFYEILPNKSETKPEQSTWEKISSFVTFYAKIRNFVTTVLFNQGGLKRDLEYLNGKVQLLKAGEMEMIKFYNLEMTYVKAKLDSMPFMLDPENKQRFNYYWKDIKRASQKFEIDVKILLANSYDLTRLVEIFGSQMEALGDSKFNGSVISIIEVFDQVVMMIIRLIEVKVDLEKSLLDTLASLNNLMPRKAELIETFANINRVVLDLQAKKAMLNSASLFSLLLAFAILFVFW